MLKRKAAMKLSMEMTTPRGVEFLEIKTRPKTAENDIGIRPNGGTTMSVLVP